MITLNEFYQYRISIPPYDFTNNQLGFNNTNGSDISAHLPLLKFIARDCNHITEFGTRDCYSTSALLMGCKGKVVSYDIIKSATIFKLEGIVDNNHWQFIQRDTTDPLLNIESTDFLFIDSLHTYQQVKLELRQAKYVKKYIGFHDTFSHGLQSLDIPGQEGINRAINEFLEQNVEWQKVYEVFFNHGLLIIERIQ